MNWQPWHFLVGLPLGVAIGLGLHKLIDRQGRAAWQATKAGHDA